MKLIPLNPAEARMLREFERMNISLTVLVRELKYQSAILERSFPPPDALEFDKIYSSTSAISGGGSITLGTFEVPDNSHGWIKKIGLSMPVPDSPGNLSYQLLINKIPFRDWTWSHNTALNIDIGMGRGGVDNPVDISIPVRGGDKIEFKISATNDEASKSYAIRLKGWYRRVNR